MSEVAGSSAPTCYLAPTCQKPTQLAPRSWTSSLNDCDKIHFYCLSRWDFVMATRLENVFASVIQFTNSLFGCVYSAVKSVL